MNTNKVLLATLGGGVVFFLLGFLFYVALFGSFFEANQGSATGVMKENPMFIGIIIANLITAFLLAYIFNRWAGISTFTTGAAAGVIIVGLMTLSFDLMMYSTSNIFNLNGALLDVVIMVVIGAITGGVVGWILGYERKS